MDFLYDPSRIIVFIDLYIDNKNALITDLLLHSQLNTSNFSNSYNDYSKLQVVPIQYSNISITNSSSETSHHQSITVVSKEQKQQFIVQPIPPTLETITESKKRLLDKLDKNTKKREMSDRRKYWLTCCQRKTARDYCHHRPLCVHPIQ